MAKHHKLEDLPELIEGILNKKYKTKSDAADSLGLNVSTISRACSGIYNERQPTEVMVGLGLEFKTVVVQK